MKKFLIFSLVALLISGGIFAFSLKHYIDVTSAPAAKEAAPTEAPATEAPDDAGETPTLDSTTANDYGIFSAQYERAQQYVANMTREQMVGQMIIDVVDDNATAVNDINQYSLGGVLFSSLGKSVSRFFDRFR